MRYLLQRTRFLEQMAGPRDDFEFFLAGQLLQSALVELDDDVVVAADDQKNRGFDACEGVAGEIRAAAAGDDGADALPARSSGDERGSGARAGAEVADSNIAGFGIGLKPIGCAEETFSQESDIEAEICRDLVHALLLRREQIDEKCGEACALEHMGHVTVARAEAAAAAAVREENDTRRSGRNGEITGESGRDGDAPRHPFTFSRAARSSNSRTSSSVVWEKSSNQAPTA